MGKAKGGRLASPPCRSAQPQPIRLVAGGGGLMHVVRVRRQAAAAALYWY